MWFPGLMYSEAYYWACTVDEDAACLVRKAYNHDQISWEEADRQTPTESGMLLWPHRH